MKIDKCKEVNVKNTYGDDTAVLVTASIVKSTTEDNKLEFCWEYSTPDGEPINDINAKDLLPTLELLKKEFLNDLVRLVI